MAGADKILSDLRQSVEKQIADAEYALKSAGVDIKKAEADKAFALAEARRAKEQFILIKQDLEAITQKREDRIAEIAEEEKDLLAGNKTLLKQKEALEQNIADLEAKRVAVYRSTDKAENELEDAQNQLIEAQKATDDKRAELRDVTGELQNTVDELNTQITNSQNQLSTAENDHLEQYATLQAELEVKAKELIDLEHEYNKLLQKYQILDEAFKRKEQDIKKFDEYLKREKKIIKQEKDLIARRTLELSQDRKRVDDQRSVLGRI